MECSSFLQLLRKAAMAAGVIAGVAGSQATAAYVLSTEVPAHLAIFNQEANLYAYRVSFEAEFSQSDLPWIEPTDSTPAYGDDYGNGYNDELASYDYGYRGHSNSSELTEPSDESYRPFDSWAEADRTTLESPSLPCEDRSQFDTVRGDLGLGDAWPRSLYDESTADAADVTSGDMGQTDSYSGDPTYGDAEYSDEMEASANVEETSPYNYDDESYEQWEEEHADSMSGNTTDGDGPTYEQWNADQYDDETTDARAVGDQDNAYSYEAEQGSYAEMYRDEDEYSEDSTDATAGDETADNGDPCMIDTGYERTPWHSQIGSSRGFDLANQSPAELLTQADRNLLRQMAETYEDCQEQRRMTLNDYAESLGWQAMRMISRLEDRSRIEFLALGDDLPALAAVLGMFRRLERGNASMDEVIESLESNLDNLTESWIDSVDEMLRADASAPGANDTTGTTGGVLFDSTRRWLEQSWYNTDVAFRNIARQVSELGNRMADESAPMRQAPTEPEYSWYYDAP